MRNLRKRIVSIIVTLAICFTLIPVTPVKEASAATVYITVETFAKYVAQKLELTSIEGSASSGYVNALMDKGIIKDGDFKSYKGNITRGDALVLLNRADEYLYGNTLEDKLVQTALDKRISDISKVAEGKREDVAKAYLKGFMKGYSNGEYCTDRELKVKSKITRSGAISCIRMLLDKSKRAQISPDGQLIRTTNLPKYAKYYPYILASYSNKYYDWKFFYEIAKSYGYDENGVYGIKPYVKYIDYTSPVEVSKRDDIENFDLIKDQYLDGWVDKVKTYMECIFNVDYRTIDNEWKETLMSTLYSSRGADAILDEYIGQMKANETIVEASTVAVDGSSLYYFDGDYYLRVYVRYRINSSKMLFGAEPQPGMKEDYKYNNIIYSRDYTNLTSYKIGIWKECGYDIKIVTASGNPDTWDKGVARISLFEYNYINNIIK